MRGVESAVAHCFPNAAQKTSRSVSTTGGLINYRTAICCFRTTPQKIEDGKQHDLESQTDDEQLLITAWFKSEETEVQVSLTDVIEDPPCRDVADIHYHVDDRERDRALRDSGV